MTLPPIIKTLQVPLAPDRAFDLFTLRMGESWPLATHAVSAEVCKAPATGVEVPQEVGGIVLKTLADGNTASPGEPHDLPARTMLCHDLASRHRSGTGHAGHR